MNEMSGQQTGQGENIYRRALRQLRPAFAAACSFSAAVNILMLTGSVYMLQVYDRVLSSGSVPTLLGLFAIVVVLYAFLGLYDFLRTRLLGRAAMRLDLDTGEAAFRAWIAAGAPGGTTASSAQPLRDLETMRSFVSSPAIVAIFDIPWLPLYLAVLFLIHPTLGWLTLAGALTVVVIAMASRMLTAHSSRAMAGAEAAERALADDARAAAEAVLGMGMSGPVAARWRHLRSHTLAAGQAGGGRSEALATMSRAFRLLLQSAVLTVGAWLVLRQEISAGMIVAATILSGRALAPVDQAIGHWRTIGRAIESHHRLSAFFAIAAAEPPHIALPAPTGRIEVRGLTRRVPGAAGAKRPAILREVSFTLEPGDGLCVIGASASGKSSLARLLAGIWSPDEGDIRLDGATLDQWDPAVRGRHIGYLPQRLDLMPGTIRDMIARFDPTASDKAVIAAAQLADVHEMILCLPDGYATRIGRNGEGLPLSGGQVQRLGLARAVFGMPRLVILDEPNSNLDADGEVALARSILTMRAAGSVVIVMAHRKSVIAAVNKLLLLNEGTVTRFGTKEAVLGNILRVPSAPASAARSETLRRTGLLPRAVVQRVAGGSPRVLT